MNRRFFTGLAVFGGAWAVMARPWTWFLAPSLEFEPMQELAPFRRLVGGGEVSGGAAGAVLLGLDAPAPVDPGLEAALRADLTGALWGDWEGGGPVPVTYFTDIQCPICRVMEARLAALDGVHVVTREYPVFGEASERAARAVLAAGLQGAAEAMRARLQRSRVVSVGGMGLDAERFAVDFEGPEVAARLAEDRALARIFGLPGTPALVVGRTRVVGLVGADVLEALVAEEAPGL